MFSNYYLDSKLNSKKKKNRDMINIFLVINDKNKSISVKSVLLEVNLYLNQPSSVVDQDCKSSLDIYSGFVAISLFQLDLRILNIYCNQM
jgi:hypothetical protein